MARTYDACDDYADDTGSDMQGAAEAESSDGEYLIEQDGDTNTPRERPRYASEANVFGFFLLVCSESVEGKARPASIIAATALIVSALAGQFYVTYDVLASIVQNPFEELIPEGDEFWDVTDNGYYRFAQSKSLNGGLRDDSENMPWIYWICRGESLDFHTNYAKDLIEMQQENRGPTLVTLAVFLWGCLFFKEFSALWVFLRIGLHGQKVHGGATLPRSVRAMIIALTVFRFVIALNLLWHGSHFLLYSESLKDIVLNSLALGFIYDIDESLFSAFLPVTRQQVTTDTEWYVSEKFFWERLIDQDLNALLTFFLCAAVTAWFFYRHMIPYYLDYFNVALCSLCGPWLAKDDETCTVLGASPPVPLTRESIA